jgi:transposase InsO family protein
MGIRIGRVMSDNGACYRSRVLAAACRDLGLRHLRTQPYRPRTSGKAERFIQTLENRWAHGPL